MRSFAVFLGLLIFAAACTASTDDAVSNPSEGSTASNTDAEGERVDVPSGPPATIDPASLPAGEARDFGPPPAIPEGDVDAEVLAALDVIFGDNLSDGFFIGEELDAIRTVRTSGDPRVAWLLADLLRFINVGETPELLQAAASELLGMQFLQLNAWGEIVDHLIAWDIPAPTNYLEHKRTLFTLVLPEWEPFFDDNSVDTVDYRFWSWGGVRIDDRPFGETAEPCNCIPAADNPEVTEASGGDWYEDDRIVFGVEINGEARAYPRNIMEIREMVNDTLGGRDIAMPYCTLCGSAQVYFTDQLPEGVDRPVLRTSGLLTRSNKVMYDVNTFSVFDTFLGTAVTGPLAEIELQLEQTSVVTTTWGEWKAAHPDTTILSQELALGRDSDLLNTRDADGPIFPIGDVDPRLPVQEPVLGLVTESGTPVAFHVDSARQALNEGDSVTVENINLVLSAGGVRAVDSDGNDLGGHQAFWFAWSQFHPDTELWPS